MSASSSSSSSEAGIIFNLQQMVYASSLSYLSSSSSESNINKNANTNTNTNKKTMELSPYFISSQLIPLIQIVDPISQSGVTIFEDSSPTDITTIPTETDTTTRTSSSSSISSSSRTTCTTTRTIVVAFRGSATPINFSTNLKFRLVPIDDELLSMSSLSSITATSKDTTKIRLVFTGHSLGGATAQLCAIQYYNYQQKLKQQQQQGITSNNDVDTVQVQVLPPLSGIITFGGPRIVNNELANYWNKLLLLYNHDTAACTSSNDNDNININNSMNIIIRNYIHLKDTIIKQNGPLWDQLGFGRIGEDIICEYNQPIVYNNNSYNNNSKNNNDDDDDDLPLAVVAWNILDHCQYLGIYVGPRLF
ncbi:alpha/beta-hydrolase [Fragilariopsis cylindrus CCMP1102]|uniref:Alpha/beta-hydrolase n=1 Tax=Fragilariopsis cylindrus CCMP1102 TaxID=635003 RepID=A0A1E7FAM6_9STRA|nr:alpha/beta-hydrolase [Fragilariopsis cylindrus CCMP1102]|eukprot:OEU15065.1 alpha/beta-hydrolase [Fragilariopsis cylindrus CCMP1102]